MTNSVLGLTYPCTLPLGFSKDIAASLQLQVLASRVLQIFCRCHVPSQRRARNEVSEAVLKEVDTGKYMYIGTVFLDLPKAFDLIDHETILYKLKLYHFSVTSLTCPSPLWVRIPTGTLDSLM
jgi:hypothetical protein